MVHVALKEELLDPLATLDEFDRERLLNSERKLIEHIDRLIRRGVWPARPSISRRGPSRE
jgi:hypothetical protein